MTTRFIYDALLTALLLAPLSACDFGDDEPVPESDSDIIIIEEEEPEPEPEEQCPDGQIMTIPPNGHIQGCYFECTERRICDGPGFVCNLYNGGAVGICLPEEAPDPRCPNGKVTANLEGYGRACYVDCEAGLDAVCHPWEECSRYDSGRFYCTPK